MAVAQTSGNMSPELLRVAERARSDPEGKIYALAHLIDENALERAYDRLRKGAAVGVDGVTVEEYGKELRGNLQDLYLRLRSGSYRHQPIRRIHIRKGKGKTRPIGIGTVEDKIVQGALREVLEAVYEQDFLDCSFGFRPGRSAHDALRALNRVVHMGEVNWILEGDIQSFFDNISRKALVEMLQTRVVDGSIARLVGKCLNVGVLEDEELKYPTEGTTQGSIISPMLGNIFLHGVLDTWFENQVKPRLSGRAHLIRYGDDVTITFERGDDVRRVRSVLGRRLGKYGLALHPEKTRIVPFRRPPRRKVSGKGPSTVDFLGFKLYWRRTRAGRWEMWFKTRGASMRKAVSRAWEWCKRHRHQPVPLQHAALKRFLQGHIAYFGVNGNLKCLRLVVRRVRNEWFKWLRRRSQRHRLTWLRFSDLLKDFPLPKARIKVQIWGR